MDHFSRLPPEVLDIIVAYHMKNYQFVRSTPLPWESTKPKNENLQLTSLSLVSKFFYYAVMRILMRSITINIGDYKMAELIELVGKNPLLGGMIQELKTNENPGWHSNARTVPIERFLQLLSKFTNLKSLSIEQSCDLPAPRSLTTVPLPQLPSINHLHLTFAIREGEDVITQLIKLAPNIESLDISILNFDDGDYEVDKHSSILATSSKFPFKSFEIRSSWDATKFDVKLLIDLDDEADEDDDFILSRFNLDSFIGLTILTLEAVCYSTTLLDILKITGPTLDVLRISKSYFTFTGDRISTLFENTIALSTFQIQGGHLLHQNFLHQIPVTISILETPLSLEHLLYLQQHPRPELRLRHVVTQDFDSVAVLAALPASVEVFVTRRFDFVVALEEFKAGRISKNLKTIICGRVNTAYSMKSDLVEKFNELGIFLDLSDN